MNKKQGSAMVLAVLLLAFFMALSLNMWFISQKKAERAGDKIVGNKVLTDIDGSSTLGYYEFFIASEYVNKGFVTSPAAYTITSGSIDQTNFTSTPEGISLTNVNDYFGGFITQGGVFTTTANAFLNRETITNGKISSREWSNPISPTQTWNNIIQNSIGGYRLSSLTIRRTSESTATDILTSVDGESDRSLLTFLMNNRATYTAGDYVLTSVYSKSILLDATDNKNRDSNYSIRATRTTNINIDSSGNYVINGSDTINEIVVTKQD